MDKIVSCARELYADSIFINGLIHTQDKRLPFAEAAAVSGNIISCVGSNSTIYRLVSDKTRIIDLDGRLMLPGFVDSHFHYYKWASDYKSIDFSAVSSLEIFKKIISDRAKRAKKGEWITGYGFNEADWKQKKIPNKEDLDQAAYYNPVCIWRCDLHLAAANSAALRIAGIDSTTEDTPFGSIEKDEKGEPTGILRESAINLISDIIPLESEKNIVKNMRKGFRYLHSLGITGIHDIRLMGGKDGAAALKSWQKIREDNSLDIRCRVSLPGEMTDYAAALGLRTGLGDDKLKIGHLKFFADGGMGARTAWMNEKYLDADYGIPLISMEDLGRAIAKADAAGLSAAVHAIGDRANHEVVKIFEKVEKNRIKRIIPHRIEHIQMIRPETLSIMSKLQSLVASCQPANLSIDISMIDMCAGERSRYAYTFRSVLENRIPLVFGSDAPVSDPNPLAGIYAAVTRKRKDKTPENGWYPNQAISVDQAVKAYTIYSAAAFGEADYLGSIYNGKYADMIVLDKDIYRISPDEIISAKVDMTIFDGKIVWKSKTISE